VNYAEAAMDYGGSYTDDLEADGHRMAFPEEMPFGQRR
jgi:hypothetical protein